MSQILDRFANSSNHKPKYGDSIPKVDGDCNSHASTPAAHCCKRHALRYNDLDEFALTVLPDECAGLGEEANDPAQRTVTWISIGLVAAWCAFLWWLS
jgi:hypothetical protein